MKYDEKQYKNTNKIYWYGSKVENFDASKSTYGLFCISNSFEYALRYARQSDNHWGWMFACTLNGIKNIFNARNEHDLDVLAVKLKVYFRSVEESKEFLKKKLQKKDWYYSLGEKIRNNLLHLISTLGYDGVFNYEMHGIDNQSDPAILLFDANSVIVRDKLTEEDIKKYISVNLEEEKNDQIEKYLSGNPTVNASLISYDELKDYATKKKSAEDYIKDTKDYIERMENKISSGEVSWEVDKYKANKDIIENHLEECLLLKEKNDNII